ncbi:hypothetical protein VCHA53O466_140135 [Vibrio chagasii]|nr:hypothetical protein VCHA53O466_140135 [Vibrio chagasii]
MSDTNIKEAYMSAILATVVFTQEGEHIHSWETSTDGLSANRMIEAALSTGLVDTKKELNYIVYRDNKDDVDVVLMNGKFSTTILEA